MKILCKKVECRNANTWSQSANTFHIENCHLTWFYGEFLLLSLCHCHVKNCALKTLSFFFYLLFLFDNSTHSHNCMSFEHFDWSGFRTKLHCKLTFLHTIDQLFFVSTFYVFFSCGISIWFWPDLAWPRN